MSTTSPNIVLVMSDQHRADMMGCAGDPSVQTPSLDALAGAGVRFSRVSCQGPLCMPSRASFMTERYVRDHGVFTNWEEIPADSPTYVRALREAGYHTALLGKAHLYLDDNLAIAHMDEMAGRLEALGFAEVFETGDKFMPAVPTRYSDYLAAEGLLDAYRAHIAARPTRGTTRPARTRPSPCRCGTRRRCRSRCVLRRRLARRPGGPLDRGLRAGRAVLPVRGVPRAARPVGRPGRGGGAVRRGRHLDAGVDEAAGRRRDRELRQPAARVPRPLGHQDDDRGRHPGHAAGVRGGHLGDRRRGRGHLGRARAQGRARLDLGRVHDGPRRDGREPRAHVEVRAVRAGGAGAADRAAAGGCAPRVVDSLVEQLDVPATVREIAGAPEVAGSEGRSLLGAIGGGAPPSRDVAVSENWGFAVFETARHKLVVDEDAMAPCQLFDLAEDPAEDVDLLGDPLAAGVVDELMETHVRPFFRTPPARPHASILTGGRDS